MELFLTLFGLVTLSTLFWLYLCARMHKLLKVHHPDVYEELGRPALLTNNTLQNGIRFFRFLFTRQWAKLGDATIESHGQFMLRYIAFHAVLFGVLVFVGVTVLEV